MIGKRGHVPKVKLQLSQSKVWFKRCVCAAIAALPLLHGESGSSAETNPDPKSLPAPKHVVVPKLHGPVVIDGELNEKVWAKAALLQPFFQSSGGEPEREHTQVRVWYDDNALYLGWTCQDIDIQATFINRDSKFWEEEVVEFFLAPKELNRYFELQWNPLGGVFDATIKNDLDEKGLSKNFDGDWSYTAKGMKSAVKLKEVEKMKALEESEVIAVLNTLVKQRKDSIEQFRKGGREELAQKEEAEIKVIEEYLPAAASEEDIRQAVAEAVQETGAASMKDMGKVMKATLARLAGKSADGSRVSQMVKEKLST